LPLSSAVSVASGGTTVVESVCSTIAGPAIVERLLGLGVYLLAADLAEIAFGARGVDLSQTAQGKCVCAPSELRDIEITNGDEVGEQRATPGGNQVELDAAYDAALQKFVADDPLSVRAVDA